MKVRTVSSLDLRVEAMTTIQESNTIRDTNHGISSSFIIIAYRAPIDNSNNLEHTAKTLA